MAAKRAAKKKGGDVGRVTALPDEPSYRTILGLVEFTPEKGIIRLDGQRMILDHAQAFAERRREIIEAIGMRGARALYTRIGYLKGTADAERWRIVHDLPVAEAFAAGTRNFAVNGYVVTSAINMIIDHDTGKFEGDFYWTGSIEAETHRAQFGVGAWPACWEIIGYACGYSSVVFGKPILFREYECVAMGHERCRTFGKPLEEWDDPSDDLAFFNVGPFVNRFAKKAEPVVRTTPRKEGAPAIRTSSATSPNRELVGASAGFVRAVRLLEQVAATDTTVLFQGETGVGKEMFARALHAVSPRAAEPFIAVNCAAIPDDLVEAELFGVEKGAFTGAIASRPGRFERAHRGTLFLDEIGSLTLSAQGKLLRALQEGEIERVGDTRTRHVDVRVVAAANEDLYGAVQCGRFREDLYFRLNVFPIDIPPLRERPADIPLLVNHFLGRLEARFGKRILGLSDNALSALWSHNWPGNIRELENVLERAAILVPDNEAIDLQHLFAVRRAEKEPSSPASPPDAGISLRRERQAGDGADALIDLARSALNKGTSLKAVEDCLLHEALKQTHGNVSAAARLLGITRSQLNYRLGKMKAETRETE